MAFPRPPSRRAAPCRDEGVAEVLGAGMLVAIAVFASIGFSVVLLNIPPPSTGVTTTLEAFVLPSAPDRLVVEHRGGTSIPLGLLGANVDLGDSVILAKVGERIAAGDPAWSVVPAGGSPKPASGDFEAGDQLRYTSAGIRGKVLSIAVVHEGKGRVDLGPVRVQEADAIKPTPVSARTTSTTTIEVTFDGPLFTAVPTDFLVTNPVRVPSAARLLGDGTRVELVLPSIAADATPTITTLAVPLGTTDLGGNVMQGNVALVATDGAAPAITAGPGVDAGLTTATVTWTTDEAGDSKVEFGPTSALGRSTSDATAVTSHALTLGGLSPGTLYSYKVSSADAAGNRGTSAVLTFTTLAPQQGNNPTFSGAVVNIIYGTTQDRAVAAKMGINIINPSSTALQVDLLRLTASPTIGAGASSKFFRGALTNAVGSDAEFSCAWTGTNSDVATCDPVGTFTLPAKGMKQVVLQFTTSNENSDQHTIVTAEAVITSPVAQTLTYAQNVRHMPGGLHFELFSLSGAGGDPTAGHAAGGGGVAREFHYRWNVVSGNAKLATRFIIPAGWTALSVPDQASLTNIALNVRQPTPTSQGYVDVAQDLVAGSVDFYFRVTPPAGADALVMQVDFEGSKEGSSRNSFQALHWFGVSIT